jgi:hypothetical protein
MMGCRYLFVNALHLSVLPTHRKVHRKPIEIFMLHPFLMTKNLKQNMVNENIIMKRYFICEVPFNSCRMTFGK